MRLLHAEPRRTQSIRVISCCFVVVERWNQEATRNDTKKVGQTHFDIIKILDTVLRLYYYLLTPLG